MTTMKVPSEHGFPTPAQALKPQGQLNGPCTWLFGRGPLLAFSLGAGRQCKFISHTPTKSIEVIS